MRTDTSARGRTATASAMLDPADTDDGEQAALDLLATGKLEVKGRLVDASKNVIK